jgi:hypothetical protein
MKHSPSWEANSRSPFLRNFHSLRCLKVHYSFYHWLTTHSYLHPDDITPYPHVLYFNIHCKDFLESMPTSFKCSFTPRYSDSNLVCISLISHACYHPCCDQNIWRKFQIMNLSHNKKWSITTCSFGKGMKLTTHLHLMQGQESWSSTSTPPYIFMA